MGVGGGGEMLAKNALTFGVGGVGGRGAYFVGGGGGGGGWRGVAWRRSRKFSGLLR